MKLAYVWYNSQERDAVRSVISSDEPNWELLSINEKDVSNFTKVLKLLKSGYDAILVHLSLPFCLAIKMAEISHRDNIFTKIILFSNTNADRTAILGFFDGIIHPVNEIINLTQRIKAIVSEERKIITDEKELNSRILKIFNTSSSLKGDFVSVTGLRHKSDFDLDDYHLAINNSMIMNQQGDESEEEIDVFLSYSSKDTDVANELVQIFIDNGLSCYMASKSLSGGELWEEAIRRALFRSKELVVLLTPNSIKSSWVMIEAGAAWVLQKPIIPCIQYVKASELPEPISKHQAVSILTYEDKKNIAQQVKASLKNS